MRIRSTSTFDDTLQIGGDTSSNVDGIKLFAGGMVEVCEGFAVNSVFRGKVAGSGTLNIDLKAGGDAVFLGNVGVGTSSPRRNFHVHNPATATTGLMLTNANTGEANDSQGFQLKVAADSHVEISQMENSHLGIFTNATERMRIDSSGKVGIGETSPSANLIVKQSGSAFTAQSQTVALFQRSSTTGHSAKIAIVAGNAASSDINFGDTDDEDAGLIQYVHADNSFKFTTNAGSSPAMLIDNSGNVGIGSTSPSHQLTVHNASTTGGTIEANRFSARDNYGNVSGLGNGFVSPAANTLAFATASTERMRIDSSGRVMIGTIAAANSTSMMTIEHAGGDAQVTINSGPTSESVINMGDTGDFNIGAIRYNQTSNAFRFFTNNAERMRIDTNGFIGIGTDSAAAHSSSYDGPGLQVHNNIAGRGVNLRLTCNVTGPGAGSGSYFAVDGVNRSLYIYNKESAPIIFGPGNSEKARISSGGKLTVPGVYNGTTTGGGPVYVEADGDLLRYTSSLKYKTDVETLEDARADAILNCRPVWYRSKCANDIKTEGAEKSDWGWYGFIAEELAEIEPRLVNWATKDAVVQEDGTNKTVERDPADYEAEGVRYENFVPLLLNLVKRQQIAIETLEAKVATLEAN